MLAFWLWSFYNFALASVSEHLALALVSALVSALYSAIVSVLVNAFVSALVCLS